MLLLCLGLMERKMGFELTTLSLAKIRFPVSRCTSIYQMYLLLEYSRPWKGGEKREWSLTTDFIVD